MNQLKLIQTLLYSALLLMVAIVAPACAEIPPSVQSAAVLANNVAKKQCAKEFSELQGISFEDAARGACKARELLDLFLICDGDETCAKRVAGNSYGLMGLSGK